jgi:sulfoxide reductase heme-binding subunit YedZ
MREQLPLERSRVDASKKRRRLSLWYLAPVGILAVVLTIAAEVPKGAGRPIDWAIRSAALLGYQLVFVSIISSAYVVQLARLFGRPFIKLHHIASLTGLVLITLHPMGVAYDAASARVFVPDVSSIRAFLELGGRPAWYLITIAALVALLRRPIGPVWRVVHPLSYVAFVLATVHANLIGTNLQAIVPRVLSILMALAATAVFVRRRVPRRGPAKAAR